MYLKSVKIMIGGLLFVLCLFILSCLNKYEREAVGFYTSSEQLSYGKTVARHDSIFLKLDKDKVCIIQLKNRSFKGRWKAYDNGDHTILEIFGNSPNLNPLVEGYLGDGIIKLWSHSDTLLHEYDEISFKKRNNL